MSERVYVTEDEMAELMARTLDTEHVVPLAFGAGEMWIESGTPSTRWALLNLCELRGIDVSDLVEAMNQ